MASTGEKVAEIVAFVAGAIGKMNAKQLEDAHVNLAKILLPKPVSPSSNSSKNTGARDVFGETDALAIVQQLSNAQTRIEGFNILDNQKLSRQSLSKIAKAREVHISKEDDVHRIREKIVEAIVGSRLNSQAIRGDAGS